MGTTATRDTLFPFEGQKYYNVDTDIVEIYAGGAWGGGPTSPNVPAPTYIFPAPSAVLTRGRSHVLASTGDYFLPEIAAADPALVIGEALVFEAARGVGSVLKTQGVDTMINHDSASDVELILDVGHSYIAVYNGTAFEIYNTSPNVGNPNEYNINFITADVVNPAPNTYHLIDATAGEVNITVPDVVPANEDWYSFTLIANTNHANIRAVGSSQIQSSNVVNLSTVHAQVLFKSDGVADYEGIQDSRDRYRLNKITVDTALASGFESGALYVCAPPDSTEITITIVDWDLEHEGNKARFIKESGDNAIVNIRNVTGDFLHILSVDDTSIEITAGDTGYILTQDSRPSASEIRLNFHPSTGTSVFEPGFAGILTAASPTPEVLITPPITVTNPLTPQSIGFFINDEKGLIGTISDRLITAIGQIKKTSDFSRDAKIKFKYYEYDFDTEILNPVELAETSFSATITGFAVNTEVLVSATLPENTWAVAGGGSNKLLVIELLAIKVGSGGADSDPTLDFTFGGSAPSLTYLDVPVGAINHATLGGVVPAETGVPDGHVDNDFPLQLPELTTAERDAIGSPNAGMQIQNTTTGQVEEYQSGAWGAAGGGGGSSLYDILLDADFSGLTGAGFTSMDLSAYSMLEVDVFMNDPASLSTVWRLLIHNSLGAAFSFQFNLFFQNTVITTVPGAGAFIPFGDDFFGGSQVTSAHHFKFFVHGLDTGRPSVVGVGGGGTNGLAYQYQCAAFMDGTPDNVEGVSITGDGVSTIGRLIVKGIK